MGDQDVFRPESGRQRLYSKEGVLRETFGTGQCWWQERINMDRLRRERKEKTREQLKKYGLGALLWEIGQLLTARFDEEVV